MERSIKISLLVAPLAAIAVALGTLFWIPGGEGGFPSLQKMSWASPGGAFSTQPASQVSPDQLIELEVRDVIPIEEADTHAVVLVSKDQSFVLPIFVTEEAAVSIAFRLAQQDSPHPLAADLLDDVVEEMGGKVTEVRIDDVQDDIYTSRVTIKQDGKDHSINARPSDAIAMALTGKAKITCTPKVLEAAGISQQEIDQLREHMGVGGGGQDEGFPMDEPGGAVPVVPDDSNIRL